ncbi:MAG: phosphate ABC transporter substrate-binding protein PstS [Tessaracoccus sp.]|uniref:phosphate ABC transporter substrate-binding protein PstS n=1 Tax=Tessaracoccus sp. TaxID=1971211 RepID=UPI001EC1823A|nr:phosphate ABC transporter substrate-binding protein PstS [Tessaracoccus sp.]MBK7822645.1 phosphate ABC transporter substrate-binding protein PstS [Tessaracoccus sp.]
MNTRLTAALGLAAALSLSACAANEIPGAGTPGTTGSDTPGTSSGLSGTLAGKGASSAKVAQETWIAAFQTANTAVTINYSPDGSGAGREAFMGGGADFAGSDRALKTEENVAGAFKGCADASAAIDVPIYVSPIAVVFNLDGVTELNLTPEVLAKIFHGDISNWNDPAIAAINDGATFPDLAITAVHRSDKSGTTGNFTDYLAVAAADVWTGGSVEEWPLQGGEAAKGTSGVVAAVTGGAGTIGYADASQAGKASIAKVGPDGAFELPTEEAAIKALEASPIEEGRAENDIAIALDRTATGYPLVLVSYGIACAEYKDPAKGALVKSYLEYVASEEGQAAAAASAGSAPLSAGLRDKVLAALATIK